MTESAFQQARLQLLEELRKGGIHDEAVLRELGQLPREDFVPSEHRERAYWNRALPAEGGQTISQPFVVARMTELLRVRPGDRILELGTGTGYQTALLVRLGAEVFTIERDPAISASAAARLNKQQIGGVHFCAGDGTQGWAEHAPYDGILVTAGAPSVPPPLLAQLAEGGRLVIPIGDRKNQIMQRITRRGSKLVREDSFGCRFVPLIGRFGWPPTDA